MRILLTNDDGIFAPGIAAMYRGLESVFPAATTVVAPETVQSATGHAITISSPLLTQRVTVDDLFTGTAVAGRPADCVKLAANQLLPARPDLVVSGINAGANVGINVIYSGTVAAAIEAAFLGFPAIAVSLYLRPEIEPDFAGAAKTAASIVAQCVEAGLKPGEVVSVNLPALAAGASPAGVRIARQCTRPWVDTYERRLDPRGREYFWNNSIFKLGQTDQDTDVAALRDGYVTITPLQFDLTEYGMMRRWQERPWHV